MNLEELLAAARPFLFHTATDPQTDDQATGPVPAARQPRTHRPARTRRPRSRWFLTPHALLRRSPWGKFALLGVFHRYPDAVAYASAHYKYQSLSRTTNIHTSSSAWTDSEGYTYLICPHPNRDALPYINPFFDPTHPRTGAYHLRYKEPRRHPITQARFPTKEAALACLSMSRNLDKAVKRHFDDEKEKWVWEYRDGTRYSIQRWHTRTTPTA